MSEGEGSTIPLLCVGDVNYDFVMRGDSLPEKDRPRASQMFVAEAGGKGFNQAVMAGRLQEEVHFVGAVGEDCWGDFVLKSAQEQGLSARHILKVKGVETGAVLLMEDHAGHSFDMWYEGANREAAEMILTEAQPLLMRTDVLLLQMGLPLAILKELLVLAKDAEVRCLLDAGPPHSEGQALLPYVDVVRMNRSEAEALTGLSVGDVCEAEVAAEQILQQGPEAVVIGLGRDGNLLVQKGSSEYKKPLDVKFVDGKGAGDAMSGTLAAFLAQGSDVHEAFCAGHIAAALTTRTVGSLSALPLKEDLLRWL